MAVGTGVAVRLRWDSATHENTSVYAIGGDCMVQVGLVALSELNRKRHLGSGGGHMFM